MTEGGASPEDVFHRVSRFQDKVNQQIFTHEDFSLLLREKLIGLPFVQEILRLRHTGFDVHSRVRTQNRKEAERVGKYMILPFLSLKRLFFDETTDKVRYQYDMHGSQEESMDYLEFFARVTSHIPNKGQVMVRYYGLCSNAQSGKMHKAGAALLFFEKMCPSNFPEIIDPFHFFLAEQPLLYYLIYRYLGMEWRPVGKSPAFG